MNDARNNPSRNTDKPLALITGASGGIGADLARVFAQNGHPLVLVARSTDKLEALADELTRSSNHQTASQFPDRPAVITLDLEKSDASAELAALLEEKNLRPTILVNNAGFGLNGSFGQIPCGEQAALIDLNVRSLTALTHALLPNIIAQQGAILNVASVAAFFPGPGMAVYYASKAYVLSFSQALGHELKGKGVTVSTLCPGPTESDFFTRAGAKNEKHSGIRLMPSMPVAEAGYKGLMAGKRVIVPGLQNKIMSLLSHIVPNSISMAIIARLQLNRRKS